MSQQDLTNTSSRKGLVGLSGIRNAIGMSQSDLADLAGLSLGHLSRIETGVHVCSTDVCSRIAEVLGVTPNDLIFKPSEILLSKLRLSHLRKMVAQEEAKLEDLMVLEVCGETEEAA